MKLLYIFLPSLASSLLLAHCACLWAELVRSLYRTSMKDAMTRMALTMATAIGMAGCATHDSAMRTTREVPHLTSSDQSAVRALVDGFVTTWNRHDMKGMHELDTDDVEWINVAGNYWRGKAAVYKGHDTIHRTVFAKTSNTFVETVIRAITPDVAVAVTTFKFGPVITPSGEELSEIKTRGSFILVKRDGVWKIVHFHNTTVDPDAEKNDPITWDATGFLPGRDRRTPSRSAQRGSAGGSAGH